MAERYLWPTCDQPDCGHFRAYTDRKRLDADLAKHLEAWTQPDGSASCTCHYGPLHAFPCDQGPEASKPDPMPAEDVPVPQTPAVEPETATCAACGGAIIPAPESLDLGMASDWQHVERKRDYRHVPWPLPEDDDTPG